MSTMGESRSKKARNDPEQLQIHNGLSETSFSYFSNMENDTGTGLIANAVSLQSSIY